MQRLIKILLAFVFVFVSNFCVAAEMPEQEAKETIRILAIGNSYSNNATQYVDDIAADFGIVTETYSLYYPGCSLKQHVNFYNDESEVYALVTKGEKYNWKINTMQKAFSHYNYDYITIQQGSALCDAFFSYYTESEPWINDLYDIIKENQPNAKVKIHQTWSLCNEKATEKMFNQIESCYFRAAEKIGLNNSDIIKSGKAIQLAKDNYGYADIYNTKEDGALTKEEALANNALYADNLSHLNERGKYLASLVFVETLLGVDCRKTSFVPDCLTAEDCIKLRKIAHEVVTGEKEYKQGDINGDDAVDAADLALLKKVIAKLTPIDDDSVVNPDVDGEGSTPDAADLALLKKIIAKLV